MEEFMKFIVTIWSFLIFDLLFVLYIFIKGIFNLSIQRSVRNFIIIFISHIIIAYLYYGIPAKCSVKMFYKTPIAVLYYILGNNEESEQDPIGYTNYMAKKFEEMMNSFFKISLSSNERKGIKKMKNNHTKLFLFMQFHIIHEFYECLSNGELRNFKKMRTFRRYIIFMNDNYYK